MFTGSDGQQEQLLVDHDGKVYLLSTGIGACTSNITDVFNAVAATWHWTR